MDVCLRVLKKSNKSRLDGYSVRLRNSVLIRSHVTFRDYRFHIFPTTFLEIAVYKITKRRHAVTVVQLTTVPIISSGN